MTEDPAFEKTPPMDPALIEFVVEMAGLESRLTKGDEEGFREAQSIVEEAAALQRTIES